jgi:hypothetical protein
MEIRETKKKTILPPSQKANKIVVFAILILLAFAGMLLFNKVLYDRSMYSYNPIFNENKVRKISEAKELFEMEFSPLP